MAAKPVSELINSAELYAGTDDRVKDEDNAWWVMRLPATVRADWLATLQWIRAPDRLVENSVFGDTAGREDAVRSFEEFVAAWQRVRRGEEPGGGRFRSMFIRLVERWNRDGITETALEQWDLYLDALWRYRYPQEAPLPTCVGTRSTPATPSTSSTASTPVTRS